MSSQGRLWTLVYEAFANRGFRWIAFSDPRGPWIWPDELDPPFESGATWFVSEQRPPYLAFLVLHDASMSVSIRSVHPDSEPQLDLAPGLEPEEVGVLVSTLLERTKGRADAPDLGRLIAAEAQRLEDVGWHLLAHDKYVFSDSLLLRRNHEGILVTLSWLDRISSVRCAGWADLLRHRGLVRPTRRLATAPPDLSKIFLAKDAREQFAKFFGELAIELSEDSSNVK